MLKTMAEASAALALGGDLSSDDTTCTVQYGAFVRTFPRGELPWVTKTAGRIRPSLRMDSDGPKALMACSLAEEELARVLGGGRPAVLCHPSTGASGFYRTLFPLSLVSEQGEIDVVFTPKEPRLEEILRYSVLWIQIAATGSLLTAARVAKAAGVKIVYEIDDAFWAPPAGHQAEQYCTPERIDRMWRMVEIADQVVTTTTRMASPLASRSHSTPIVLPNCLPARMWPARKRPVSGRILWAGSPTHAEDLESIAEPLGRVVDQFPEAHLVLFGQDAPESVRRAVRGRVEQLPWVEFDEYPEALAGAAAVVALAPLVDNAFNRCKSAIKAVDYGACGYPVIASPVGEYAEVLAPGVTGWLAQTSADWHQRILQVLQAPEAADPVGRALRTWVLEHRDERACRGAWTRALHDLLVH